MEDQGKWQHVSRSVCSANDQRYVVPFEKVSARALVAALCKEEQTETRLNHLRDLVFSL